MALQLLETPKALNKAFLKTKANRESLECFKVNLVKVLKLINEKKSERFSKNQTQDFLKKSAYDPIYSLNILGRNFSMTSIAETLIGKKIEVKTPDFLFVQIHKNKKIIIPAVLIHCNDSANNVL